MNTYSIVITTFDKRFEKHLVPLIQYIKQSRPRVEVIVMVNGRANSSFNQEYLSKLMRFLAINTNCFPSVFTNFQSLSKMWNRGILTASNSQCLVLNDDLEFLGTEGQDRFFDSLEEILKTEQSSFKINGSFSHFLIFKKELIEVGFFDERLLGVGEEDGDFCWRYHEKYQREIGNKSIPFILNTQSDLADEGFKKGIGHYSAFNREFIKNVKYCRTLLSGHKGMFDHKVKKVLEDKQQYPYEEFYLKNIEKL